MRPGSGVGKAPGSECGDTSIRQPTARSCRRDGSRRSWQASVAARANDSPLTCAGRYGPDGALVGPASGLSSGVCATRLNLSVRLSPEAVPQRYRQGPPSQGRTRTRQQPRRRMPTRTSQSRDTGLSARGARKWPPTGEANGLTRPTLPQGRFHIARLTPGSSAAPPQELTRR